MSPRSQRQSFCLAAFPHTINSQTASHRLADQADVVRVFTKLVQTDVMVFERKGRFQNDLRRQDFELRIDGKVKLIEFFERITALGKAQTGRESISRSPGAATAAKG